MAKELLVYDESTQKFRKLDKNNYNDDVVCGCVLLKREAINEIKKYYHICGYAIVEKKDRFLYPIDIQKDKLVVFEGTYNCMPEELKKVLVEYSIDNLMGELWSFFFFRWIFMCDSRVFDEYGPFVKLCSNILGSESRCRDFFASDVALYEPTTYAELCNYVSDILKLSCVDVNGYDYTETIKYLIDSLVKGYHINFTEDDIASYFYKISKLVDERWAK